MVIESGRFDITHFEITGLETLAEADLKLDEVLGESLFTLSTSEVEKRLASKPWISQAKVTRSFPNTLNIEIFEADPFFLIYEAKRFWLVDHHGNVFKEASIAQGEARGLPVVVGTGMQTNSEELRLVGNMLRTFEQYRGKLPEIDTIQLWGGGLTVWTKRGPTLHVARKLQESSLGLAIKQAEQTWQSLDESQRFQVNEIFIEGNKQPEKIVLSKTEV